MKLWQPEQQNSLRRSSYSTRLRTSSGDVVPLGMTRCCPLVPEPPLILGFVVSLREKEEPILFMREDLTSTSEVLCTPGMSSQHSSGWMAGGVRLGVLNSRRKLREMTEPRMKFGGGDLLSKVGAELWAGVVDSCGTLPLRLVPSERLSLAADAGDSNSAPLKEMLRDMLVAKGIVMRPSLSDVCSRCTLLSIGLSSLRGSIEGRMGLLSTLREPFSDD